ncbi:MEIOTIC F-BOX protein MOF [Triticum aestivum]|uniref:MEIOTIC F-BOX protein MOF n=1 Tax=Triticum aestivum TaxID=4565 RepID=UPI001D004462|nr:MEIOTIC F-BOX protein MOF-like [Triticum aestivum]
MRMETRGRRKRAAAARDRLSNLPDCLLQAILSQLRSRQVVHTSALSRRWRHLWRAVPCIHIDSADFPIQIDEDSDLSSVQDDDGNSDQLDSCVRDRRLFEAERDAIANLEDFADNLLFHRNLSGEALETLRLRIYRRDGRPYGSTDMISRWVRRGLRLSPAGIDIIVDGIPMEQPSYFSNTGANLGRLTEIRLDGVLLIGAIGDLFGTDSLLPVLQDLEVRNSALGYIASDTLTNLTVVYDSPASTQTYEMFGHIAAPRLASLRFELPLARLANLDFTVEELPCLAQASIRLLHETPQPWSWDDDDDDDDEPDTTCPVISNLCILLGFLCNVTSLHLSGFQEMGLTHAVLLQAVLDEPCCVFPNLKSLVLDDCNLGNGLQTLWRLLHNTPALERLALRNCKWQEDPYARKSEEEQAVETATMTTNLKLVQIVHGNNKMRSKIKRKLPQATVTK